VPSVVPNNTTFDVTTPLNTIEPPPIVQRPSEPGPLPRVETETNVSNHRVERELQLSPEDEHVIRNLDLPRYINIENSPRLG
jgi:hypothetical protein